MKQKKKVSMLIVTPMFANLPEAMVQPEPCTCGHVPVKVKDRQQIGNGEFYIAEEFTKYIDTIVRQLLVDNSLVSVLLVHMSQLVPVTAVLEETQAGIFTPRQRFHAPTGLFEQVLMNVRRVLRAADQIVEQGDKGAVIFLPDVDAEAAHRTVERIYHSINLLQAGTMVPPLSFETCIQVGSSTYRIEHVAASECVVSGLDIAYSLNLRPAITFPVESMGCGEDEEDEEDGRSLAKKVKKVESTPFMDLPRLLPVSLSRLIPNAVARKVRCVPVGKSAHCLTVAMAEPTNSASIELLQRLTGMEIFPVACHEENLNILLRNGW